jgi:uncharacterized protein
MVRETSLIESFLARRRLAMVGVSRDPRDFSRAVFAELKRRGYDVVPVNPLGGTVDGIACVWRVQDIDPPAEAAILMTPPDVTERVVGDCAEAGIRQVWMHRGMGTGAASPAAIEYCHANGIAVVTDACPFMYLPQTGFVHRAHRWCRQALHGGARTALPRM